MKINQLYFIAALLTATNCFAQTGKKASGTLSLQANRTLYDRTLTNNSNGIGFGLQTSTNTKSFIKPVLELNADLFAGTKELYVTDNDQPIKAKSGVLGIYTGAIMQPSNRLFIITTGGVNFFNGKGHFGIRPSLGYLLSKNGRFSARVAFTHIFQRDEISKQPFGYGSFALGVKLF